LLRLAITTTSTSVRYDSRRACPSFVERSDVLCSCKSGVTSRNHLSRSSGGSKPAMARARFCIVGAGISPSRYRTWRCLGAGQIRQSSHSPSTSYAPVQVVVKWHMNTPLRAAPALDRRGCNWANTNAFIAVDKPITAQSA